MRNYKQVTEAFYYPDEMSEEEIKENPIEKSVGYERTENGVFVEQKGTMTETKFIKSTEMAINSFGNWEVVKQEDKS